MKKIYLLLFTAISICSSAQIEGTWKLAQIPAALAVGPTQTDYGWWSNSSVDVTTRACLFDDSVTFDANGNFMQYMDGNTWLETFQGVASEQCGAPVAPHDGSGSFTYTYTGTQLTVNGTGAHMGLPKVVNGGEISTGATVPTSITYESTLSTNGDTLTLEIDYTTGWWKFVYQRTTLTPPPPPQTYDVTLQLDASNITIGTDGIYAGGGILGDALAVPMTDADGDGTWEGVAAFPSSGGNYVFLNSPANGGDWGAKEDLTGLACADANNWNDRLMPALTSNITVCAIFASCDPCQNPTGVEDNVQEIINIYPNPTGGLLNINSSVEIKEVYIYDVLGKRVLVENMNNNINVINVESLIDGVYFIKVDMKNNTTSTLRFVKK
jgi:hypothetical protein